MMAARRRHTERREYVIHCADCHRRLTPDCSFHGKPWLKNRVNSGKPSPLFVTNAEGES